MPRYFSVDEARASLPVVRTLVIQAQELKAQVERLQARLPRAAAPAPSNGHANGNGAQSGRLEFERAVAQLEAAVRRIEATGCQLKDLDLGLVDWPHLRDGHEVYLCWHLGEADVLYWHEIEAGMRGRQPL